jgi:KUP system potassium uptake protein
MVPLVIVDFTFLSANLLKLLEGAWVPLLFGICMVMLILTWTRGTRILASKTRKTEVPLEALLQSLEKRPPHVVPGTAVFLTSDPEFAPTALLHNLKHNKVLHEHNVILTIVTADTPRVSEEDRVVISHVSQYFNRVALKFGYMETPNVPKALAIARRLGWQFDIMSTLRSSRRGARPNQRRIRYALAGSIFIGPAKPSTPPTSSRSTGGGSWHPGHGLSWQSQ